MAHFVEIKKSYPLTYNGLISASRLSLPLDRESPKWKVMAAIQRMGYPLKKRAMDNFYKGKLQVQVELDSDDIAGAIKDLEEELPLFSGSEEKFRKDLLEYLKGLK